METSLKQTESTASYLQSQIESNSRLTLLASKTHTQTTQTSFELKSIEESNKLLATNNTTDHTTLSNYDTTTSTNGLTNDNILKKIEDIEHDKLSILYPPLRVRLQKVNEKSVALKWDHNQLNANNKIIGYRIYINNVVRGTVKPTDMKALINGISEEGEYKITVKTFDDKSESIDSNTVITRVKKLMNKSQQQDNSLNKSDAIEPPVLTKSPIEDKKSSSSLANDASTPAPQQIQQQSTIIPKIMDKLRANSPSNIIQSSILSNSASNNQLSAATNNNDKQFLSPKKDKNLHNSLLKERLLEKQQQNRHQSDEDFHELLSKHSSFTPMYSHLNVVDDKSRSPSHSPEEFSNENAQLPFSNSTNFIQNRKKTIPTSKAISIVTNNNNNNNNNMQQKYYSSPKELSHLIDYKPPISPSTPPRVPSPTQFSPLISPVKINNFVSHSPTSNLGSSTSSKTSVASYGFEVNSSSQNKSSAIPCILPGQINVNQKHKQSKSVDLSFSLNKIKQNTDKNEDECSSNNTTSLTNTTNNNNNNSLTSNNSLSTANNTSTLPKSSNTQKNFMIKSAKYSISEPNLSASITKSETSGGGVSGIGANGNTNSNTKLDLVRQSLSFDEDEDDDKDDNRAEENNLVNFNNKENEQHLINVDRARRIFKIRNKLMDDNNPLSKVRI